MTSTDDFDAPHDQGVEPGRKRERSTIRFAYGDLEDAVAVARAVHERYGSSCSTDQLAAALGIRQDSGKFRGSVATAKTFRAIEQARSAITLTPLGARLLVPEHEASARVEAFLAVPLNRLAYDTYRGRLLPPDQAFERELSSWGVAPKQATKARQALQRSADQAGFFHQGRNRLVAPAAASVPDVEALGDADQPPPGLAGEQEQSIGVKHEVLVSLFRDLPEKDDEFPAERRRAWLHMLQATLSYLYGDLRDGDLRDGGEQNGHRALPAVSARPDDAERV